MSVPDRLPDADRASVDDRKITRYLLSESHPVGRTKAAFFRRLGFRTRSWRLLRDGLVDHARAAPVIATFETDFGKKYIIEGLIVGPNGQIARLRAVWFVDPGKSAPRFVTAYPAPGARG